MCLIVVVINGLIVGFIMAPVKAYVHFLIVGFIMGPINCLIMVVIIFK